MGVACAEDSGFSFPKNLSVWWSEETEYVLQRIERWAAYARGYNRLRSARLSPGRMTMQDEPESRWDINRTTNRLVVDNGWSPNFRSQRRQNQSAERSNLRCCPLGNLDYKSNGNLDSNCLEAYSLDHSIYFKTIGEIRNETVRPGSKSKEKNNNDGATEGRPTKTTPLDCGDFLASDFDELGDEDDDDDSDDVNAQEFNEVDYELREQLDASLYSDDEQTSSQENDVIQVCRSVISEDEINNNFTMAGLPRNFINLTATQ